MDRTEEVYKLKMEKVLDQVKNLIDDMQQKELLDSVKHPLFYQRYLDWLDELNIISVSN